MADNALDNPVLQSEPAAREWLEAMLWPDGPVCQHCGVIGHATKINSKSANTRPGLYKCNDCRKDFTVTVGTIFERSHVPLTKWIAATLMLCASKKGVSAHQVHRTLGVTYKTAWFMCHRIREAMRDGKLGPLGGANKVVEIDETYVGGKAANRKNVVPLKEPVLALVERDGRVRSHHVARVNSKTLRPILEAQLDKRTYVMTDDATVYPALMKGFAAHSTVNHSAQEYVRGYFHHTNTVENYFSILKRGIIGTYHHVSPQHLKRYLAEFDFRYNERIGLGVNDAERTTRALKGIVGKRLTYRRTNELRDAPQAQDTVA
ncbi:MAG: IS1595 family transposase [Micropepsaceae bacterium]